jgi:hypothetical protein
MVQNGRRLEEGRLNIISSALLQIYSPEAVKSRETL